LNLAVFLEAAGAVLKIGSSLKPNHNQEIELAQICETLCTNTNTFIKTMFYELTEGM